MNNEVTIQQHSTKFSVVVQSDMYKKLINETLGDSERAKRFIASISSAVATNPELQKCTANTILSGALLGEALNLSPSPVLGQYYLVPFKNNKLGTIEAQFILGAKGYKQLAIRSGQYLDIDFIEVREGEYLGRDESTGKQKFKFINDDDERINKKVIGYLAYLELLNGFRKQIYWSVKQMEKHADTYSKAFNLKDYEKLKNGQIPEKDLWKYSSFWYKDFQGMAEKTLLKQLISKYGVMSIEMQEAYTKDMAVLQTNGDYEYVDNTDDDMPKEPVNITQNEDKPASKEPKQVKLDDIQ